MSIQHSIIEHRANYYFLKIEEDYISMFFESDKHRHCKAALLSIIEQWMNAKRTDTSKEDDLYVYMSYPQFVKRMFNLYGRNTVIACLDELVRASLLLRRPYTDAFNQDTFEYRLNIPEVQRRLQALPDVPVRGSLKINGGSAKVNDPGLKTDDQSFKNKPGGSPDLNGGSFKNKRNVDTTIDTNIDTSQKEDTFVNSADAEVDAPTSDNLIDWKEATDKRKAINLKGQANDNNPHSGGDSHRDTSSGDRVGVGGGIGQGEPVGRGSSTRHVEQATEGQLEQTTTVKPAAADRQAIAHAATTQLPQVGEQRGARKRKAVTQAITLTEQQQAFWDLWCNVWFNAEIKPNLTETSYSHVVKLTPYITTEEKLASLIDYTRKDLADSQGIKRKMVQLGNMVYCYAGWKQAQTPTPITQAQSNYVNHDLNMQKLEERKARLAANG
jgi:hypothetical protein